MGTFKQATPNLNGSNVPYDTIMGGAIALGDLLIAIVHNTNGAPGTAPNFVITDNSSNVNWTYVTNGQLFAGGATVLEMYYCWNAKSAPGGITITTDVRAGAGSTVTQGAGIVAQFTGALSSSDPLDVQTGAHGSDGGAGTFSTGTITPTAAGTAIEGDFATFNITGPGAGYTQFGVDASNLFCDGEYKSATSGVGVVGSFTYASGNLACVVAVFKDVPASNPPLKRTDVIFFGMT